MTRTCLFLCLCASLVPCFSTYKPVIFMHGILAAGDEADTSFKWIKDAHPGTATYTVAEYEHLDSVVNMNTQVTNIMESMSKFMQAHPEGVHLICFSQGGLVCRGVLEQLEHNVDTFISLSSPQSGQFGDTNYTKYLFPTFFRDNLYKVLYTDAGQDVSIGNYWNDPYQQDLYKNYSQFLAVINNQTTNPKSQEYKTNFLRLKKLVMIGGPDDGVITPWQSSHFAFYNDDLKIVNMTETEWFKKDSFGLKTLYASNRTATHVIPGVPHTHWHSDYEVFKEYILPYLT